MRAATRCGPVGLLHYRRRVRMIPRLTSDSWVARFCPTSDPHAEDPSMRQRLWILISTIPAAGGTLVAALDSPWKGAALAVGMIAALAILLSPLVGLGAFSALSIGQWPWSLMRNLELLTTASAFGWLISTQRPLFPRNRLLLMTGLLLAFVLLSTIHPQTQIRLWSSALAYVGHFLLVWLFVTLVDDRKSWLIVMRLMILSGVVTALVGLIQWRTHFTWPASTTAYYLAVDDKINYGKTAIDLQGWQGQFRVDSVTGTPDYMALCMQTLIPFVIFGLIRQVTWSRRLMGIGILAILSLGHILSFTRGALITTAIMLLWLGWLVDKRRLVLLGPLVVLCGCMALMSWQPLRNRAMTLLSLEREEAPEHENTAGWRLRTVPVGCEMMLKRPILGVGVGQQRWNWPPAVFGNLLPDPEFAQPIPIHNSYLLIGIETGLGGLLALLLLLATTIRDSARLGAHFLRLGDLQLAYSGIAISVAMVGLALAMFMYPMTENFRYFWMLVGMTAALSRIASLTPTIPDAVVGPS